jgi:hypothetical protein
MQTIGLIAQEVCELGLILEKHRVYRVSETRFTILPLRSAVLTGRDLKAVEDFQKFPIEKFHFFCSTFDLSSAIRAPPNPLAVWNSALCQSLQMLGINCLFSYQSQFMQAATPTIGAVAIPTSVEISPGEKIGFNVWDTADQDDFRCVLPMFIRTASVAVVCFDLSVRETFAHVRTGFLLSRTSRSPARSLFRATRTTWIQS